MSNRLACLLATLILFGLTAAAQADTIIAATGNSTTQGLDFTYDNNWKAAFLGAFEIGTGNEKHNGTQLGGKLQSNGTDYTQTVSYSAGAELNLNLLVDAYNAAKTLGNAFVYDNNVWPLGNENNAWANLTNTFEGTNWVGSESGHYNSSDGTTNHEAGYYVYETTFTANESYNYLTGSIATDNQLLGILINGILLDESAWSFTGLVGEEGITFDIAGEFMIDAGWINVGDENTLAFIVNNYGQEGNYGNPAGLWVGDIQLTDTPPGVPEPGTLLILGIAGAIGIPVCRRWRKKGN